MFRSAFTCASCAPRHHARIWLAIVPSLLAAELSHARTGKAPPVQAVIVAPVVEGTVADRVEALGTAKANESVTISANVAEKIRTIHFDDGQQVAAGELLVVLEQAEEHATLQQARARLAERELTLRRLLKLEKSKLTAPDLIDTTRSEVEQARASIGAIQARIADRVLRAPFAGRVGLRNISVGELVEVGDTIVTLDDTRQIKLDFTVPATYLAELKPGLPIEAHSEALGDTPYRGELTAVDSRVDPVTRAVQVRAVLPNAEGRIVPGVLMRVDVLRNTRPALVIPEAALVPQGEQQFVLVRSDKDGTAVATRKPIRIGARMAGRVEVVEGLAAGEQVITHGAIKVKPGDPIRILAVDDGQTDLSTYIQGKTLKAP